MLTFDFYLLINNKGFEYRDSQYKKEEREMEYETKRHPALKGTESTSITSQSFSPWF